MLAEHDGDTGAALREVIWLDDLPVGFVDAAAAGSPLYFVHTDHLGSPRKLSDAGGAPAWDGVFGPFGEVISVTGALAQNLRFPGQYHDSESALSYNWRRTYDPSLGRYLQSDPIGLAGGINSYAYVGGNPLRYVDPTGLAVGDWWDFPTNLGRAHEIACEELMRRPSSHNDKGDAMRHAEWMRRTTQETNALTAWLAGTGHEIEGLLNGQPGPEAIMDLHNNAVGRSAGDSNTSVDSNKLWTSPYSGSGYDPYQGVQ